ncbi:MAG TPA: ABC transporter permease [Chryseosolibacter sp.]|nr:ABC transporter permease [Chryseosolibacter sp.]
MIRNFLLVAVRNFLRHPSSSALNVLGLAAGFTCLILTSLWIANEFSYDRFHHQHDRIFKVMSHVEADGTFQTFDAASASIDISSVAEIEHVVTISKGTRWPNELCFRPEGKANECIYLNGIYAAPSFFSVFNFPVIKGDADPLRKPASIAITSEMATTLFGDTDPLGKAINIDDHFPVTIMAIIEDAPANSSLTFDFVMSFNVFSGMRGLSPEYFAKQFFPTFIKTNRNVNVDELTAMLNNASVLTPDLAKDKVSYQAFPLKDWRLNNKFEDGKNTGGRIEYVIIFIIIAVLVVVLAVINFVNLSTARATLRAKEIGVRKVTGAYRSSIMLQFLSESFLVVLMAFIVAAGLTQISVPLFSTLLGEQLSVSVLTGWMPFYLILFLVVVAVLAGLYPAFVMSSFKPVSVLKNHLSGHHGSQRLRKVLLVVQLSVSIAVLIFSGVMFMQLNFITKKDLGYDKENMIRVEPTYRMLQKFEVFKTELLKDPAIRHTATASANPLDLQAQNTGVSWPGKPEDMRVTFQTFGCSHEFPETLGLSLVEGRQFSQRPVDSVNSEVIVSTDAVEIMGLKSPVGSVIRIGDSPCVIVGIVNDFHTRPLHEAKLPVILFRSDYVNSSQVYVKYQTGKTREAMKAIASAYQSVEPSFTMKYWFQDETFDNLYKTEEVASRLISVLGIIALIIAVIGIVGLSTFNVVKRLREMSIRKVFGASGAQILQILSKEFIAILFAALLIAVPVVWYAADLWLSGFAYHVAMPWWLYIVCPFTVALFTIMIICTQGLKAAYSNPTEILRSE